MGMVISLFITLDGIASPDLAGQSNLFPKYVAKADSSVLVDSITYLYGNVNFTHKDLKIKAKKGVITKDKVIAIDSVDVLSRGSRGKGELKILTDSCEYFWNKEIKLYNGFEAHKEHELLIGERGKYFENKLWLYEDVKYINEADSMTVCGDECFYNLDTNYGIMTLLPKFEAHTDSIEITGDTIKLFSDTLAQVNRNVTIKLSSIVCHADSLSYFIKRNETFLYGSPWIVSDTDSLGGDELKIILNKRKVDKIIVGGRVWGTRWRF
ncbi:MAG: hypothetical protein QMD71_04865 [bacterium]|nr:hypothetical protein [bacterium]